MSLTKSVYIFFKLLSYIYVINNLNLLNIKINEFIDKIIRDLQTGMYWSTGIPGISQWASSFRFVFVLTPSFGPPSDRLFLHKCNVSDKQKNIYTYIICNFEEFAHLKSGKKLF